MVLCLKRYLFLCIAVFCFNSIIISQTVSSIPQKVILRKEYSVYGLAHTAGLGCGFSIGRHLTGFSKRLLESELLNIKHPKEFKYSPYNENSKKYVFGKLNNFYVLRVGGGFQKVVNEKPLWGGVEIKYFFVMGACLGLEKPVYLYVANSDSYFDSPVVERYDPLKHNQDNIIGRGPFLKGFGQLGLVPGGYLKFGYDFEFGTNEKKIKSIKVGSVLSVFYKEIPIMAFNNKSNIFFNLFVSYHFGRRSL